MERVPKHHPTPEQHAYVDRMSRHAPELHRIARRWCGPEQAADLVHDAFVKVLMVKEWAPPDNELAYMVTVTKNCCFGHMRRAAARYEVVSAVHYRTVERPTDRWQFTAEDVDVGTMVADAESLHLTTRILRSMGHARGAIEKHAWAISLHLSGLSPAEVRQELGLSEATYTRHVRDGARRVHVAQRAVAGHTLDLQSPDSVETWMGSRRCHDNQQHTPGDPVRAGCLVQLLQEFPTDHCCPERDLHVAEDFDPAVMAEVDRFTKDA